MPNYVLYWIWPSENRRCWQTLLQLHMVALWLPLLFKREGRRVLTLIQTGSAARLWSSKLSPLQRGKETFNKGWLVPSAGFSIHPPWAVTLHLSTSSCLIFLLPTRSSPIFQLTPSPTHSSCASYCQPMLSWHGKVIKKGDNYFFNGAMFSASRGIRNHRKIRSYKSHSCLAADKASHFWHNSNKFYFIVPNESPFHWSL